MFPPQSIKQTSSFLLIFWDCLRMTAYSTFVFILGRKVLNKTESIICRAFFSSRMLRALGLYMTPFSVLCFLWPLIFQCPFPFTFVLSHTFRFGNYLQKNKKNFYCSLYKVSFLVKHQIKGPPSNLSYQKLKRNTFIEVELFRTKIEILQIEIRFYLAVEAAFHNVFLIIL